MFCLITEVVAQDEQLFFNKTIPNFQRLPMSKVDQSYLHVHEVPPLPS